MGSIVGSIAGGILGASGSKSAAKAQAAAADRATQSQEKIFKQQVALQEPFRQAGVQANNQLMYLLGLTPNASTGTGAMTYEQARQRLLPQYTRTTSSGAAQPSMAELLQDPITMINRSAADVGGWTTRDGGMTTTEIDNAGLEAAIRRMMAENQGQQFDTSDPRFGSLMRRFSMEDFEADPGYEFRRQEGMRGVEGGAAARGGLLSGAALKAIQKYGQGLASQEYGNAYNRFTSDQTNQYNRLAGLVNTGQGATNQVSNAAGQFGQQQANNIIGAGNAQASGIMGGTNALVGGLNQGLNYWNQNELMKQIQRPSTGGGWGTGDAYGNQDYGSYF